MITQATPLHDLIAAKASEYAQTIRAAAARAHNEEELRIESERQLGFIAKLTEIKLEGRHEYTVASGRIDSVYSRVIIEYKNPKSAGDRIGADLESAGSKKVIEQIKKRFKDMKEQHHQPLNSLLGVGLDGNRFIFIRFRDEKWEIQEPVEVTKHSAERFLWALFNLGNKGKPFSPSYLADDFGSEGNNTVAIAGVGALYNAIANTSNPKARTFFNQWKILFSEVCGYDVDDPSERIKKLGESYHISSKHLKPAELLFALHTYYALFMKLLASEIVAFFHKLPTPLQAIVHAQSSGKLKREMEDLEAGGIFRHLRISNFLEGDLFAWYTAVWSEDVEKLVRSMAARLDDYNPGTLSEDPAGSRDLLKKLYQQLFPKSVRHDLGEYYTPDWLAEHVLEELDYSGDPDKRLLDPACGSGTFLVMAINRIRAWFEKNREHCGFDESSLGKKILSNIIGFDLNPLAVMAARTNYLIAIRDLISHTDGVEIPIYLCDSIVTPGEYGDLFTGQTGNVKELKTAAARFLIPTEVTTDRTNLAKYTDQLGFCISNKYSASQFLDRCRDEALPISSERLHVELYRELVKLDEANKNGVWARIIKNSFAPIFCGKVDYIAGNPPWIGWESLPTEYRKDSGKLWERYKLIPETPQGNWFRVAKLDLSALFVYLCMDAYLKPNGKLGYVITQSVYKNVNAGRQFRRCALPETTFRVVRIDDMVALAPFDDASNRTCCMFFQRDKKVLKDIPYYIWKKTGSDALADLTLAEVQTSTSQTVGKAHPENPKDYASPWLTPAGSAAEAGLMKVKGDVHYHAREGCNTRGANAIFWVSVLRGSKSECLVENFVGRAKSIPDDIRPRSVERRFLFPLLRSSDLLGRWRYKTDIYAIVPQDEGKPIYGYPEGDMKVKYPKTYAYLRVFQKALLKRKPLSKPFYSLYDIGPYTFSPWKVVWLRPAGSIEAVVIGTVDGKPVIPQETITLVAVQDELEAHYLCAVLNSTICNLAAVRSGHPNTKSFGSPEVLQRLPVPQFDGKVAIHRELSLLSKKCHQAAIKNDCDAITPLERDIDGKVASLWGISQGELKAIQTEFK